MDIHEYQAKELLSGFGVPIQRGAVAYSPTRPSTAPPNSAAGTGP